MKSSHRGFSLLEVVLAITLMASALILLTSSWGTSFSRLQKTKKQNEIALLLERKMIEVELEFRDKPLSELPEERGPEEIKGYPDYTWKLTTREFQMPDLTAAMRQGDENPDPMMEQLVKKMGEYFGKAVKEVKVSIIIKAEKNRPQQEHSIATYFVDHTAELNLGIPQ